MQMGNGKTSDLVKGEGDCVNPTFFWDLNTLQFSWMGYHDEFVMKINEMNEAPSLRHLRMNLSVAILELHSDIKVQNAK